MTTERFHLRSISAAGGAAGQVPMVSADGTKLEFGNQTGLDAEGVRDTIAAALVAGSNVTITPDDAANTITIAATSGGGGGGGGGVLASKLYNPATDVVYNTTSSTMVDIDATNLSVTFTATSTAAIVTLSGLASMSATGSIYYWGLRDASGTVPDSSMEMYYNTTLPFRLTGVTKISGLTIGASYTWKWAWMRALGTATCSLSVSKQTTASQGPALMTVEAA